MIAYDFPLLGLFWTMLIFFFWIAWIMLLFRVIIDIFRNKEMGGGGKAFWLIFVILIPWLGVLIYLLSNGAGMAARQYEDQVAQREAFNAYVRDAAGSGGGAADELAKLADLRDRGVINDAEFAAQKAKLLA
jgi:hypothetical protein